MNAEPDLTYLNKRGFWDKPDGWVSVGPLVAKPETKPEADLSVYDNERLVSNYDKEQDNETDEEKEAKRAWKAEHPETTAKAQRDKLARGEIDQLPWISLKADNELPQGTTTGFGIAFPDTANKGDTFVRVDIMPNRVYKYNGNDWILVDKNISDNYTYDIAYIDHLIAKIGSGEYDPELLNDNERDQVAARINQSRT